MKRVKYLLLVLGAKSLPVFANAQKIKRFGQNGAKMTQSFGAEIAVAALCVCGVLYLIGYQKANELLGKIMMGIALIFGGTSTRLCVKRSV
jgi:type IV secretory pathway VirB2 component (pilin)